MDIEVVLTEADPKLGQRGEVVKVSRGFALNFLLPHKKALVATPANLKQFEEVKARQAKAAVEIKAKAQEVARKIEALSLTIEVLVGDGQKLYGAVTSQEIQQALTLQGIAIDKKSLLLEEPIRKLGAYQVTVKLHPEVTAKLKVWVVQKKS